MHAASSFETTVPSTNPRLPFHEVAADASRALGQVNAVVARSTLGKKLIELVYLRVSQINGCAFCVDMHVRDLLAQGEDLQRINSLSTWREVSLFTEQERAALNWADSLTLIATSHAPDADYAPLAAHFTDREVCDLTMVVALMSAWNRVAIGMRLPVKRTAIVVPA